MSLTYIRCGVLCFHLHSAERGAAVESTDSVVMPVARRERRRVSLRQPLMTTGVETLFPDLRDPQSAAY